MAKSVILSFNAIRTEEDFETQFIILGEYRALLNKSDYAETVRNFHYRVATSESGTIASSWGKYYQRSQQAFLWAIREAYPEMDCWNIYDIWVDCSEDVKYCAEYLKTNMLDKLHERNHCRIYHTRCNPDCCYMGDEMPKEGDIYRNGDEWSAGN